MIRISLHAWMLKHLNSKRSRLALATGLLMFGSSCSSARQYVQSFKRDDKPVAESADQEKAIADGKDQTKSKDPAKAADSQPVKTASLPEKPKSENSSVAAEPTAKESTPAAAEVEKVDISALIDRGEDPFAAGGSSQPQIQQTSVQKPETVDANDEALRKWVADEPANPFAAQAAAATAPASDAVATSEPAAPAAPEQANPFAAPTVSAGTPTAAENPFADTVSFQPDPRLPVAGPAACPPGLGQTCPPCGDGPPPFPSFEDLDDEYVCDGGDKNLPVHYDGNVRVGLDSEDTVIEYVDHTGAKHVKPCSTVCVYAPRFGAVRSATLPETGVTVDKVAGHHDETKLAGLDTRLVPDEQRKADEAIGLQMRQRASGINAQAGDQGLHQNVAAIDHVKLLNAYEDFAFVREGQFGKADPAVIGLALQAAVEWADGRRAIIVAHDQAGQMVQARATAQDMTGVEDRRKKGELCIIKVADKASAHPGDVITFTIRFDNVGDRELHGVRVVDNLSPRLKFVEGSIESNLDGLVDVTENGASGELLTFEFDKPLAGKTGGHVTFKCTVR